MSPRSRTAEPRLESFPAGEGLGPLAGTAEGTAPRVGGARGRRDLGGAQATDPGGHGKGSRLPGGVAGMPDLGRLQGAARGVGEKLLELTENEDLRIDLALRVRRHQEQMVAERNSRKHNFIKQNVETAGHWCAAGRGERLVELTNMKAERAREAQASRQEMQRLRIERILERIGRRERHEELVRAAERGRRTAKLRLERQAAWMAVVVFPSRIKYLAERLEHHRFMVREAASMEHAAVVIQGAFRVYVTIARAKARLQACLRIQKNFRANRQKLQDQRRKWAIKLVADLLYRKANTGAVIESIKKFKKAVQKISVWMGNVARTFSDQRQLTLLQWEKWETEQMEAQKAKTPKKERFTLRPKAPEKFIKVPRETKMFCITWIRRILRKKQVMAVAQWEEDMVGFRREWNDEESVLRAKLILKGQDYDEEDAVFRFKQAAPPKPRMKLLWSKSQLVKYHAGAMKVYREQMEAARPNEEPPAKPAESDREEMYRALQSEILSERETQQL